LNPLHSLISERSGHRCEYCRAPESIFNLAFEVEHIVPVAAGGKSTMVNLALACRSCNAFKSSRRDYVDAKSGLLENLYHPRQDLWEEHFLVDVMSGEIIGLTGVGRATVAGLRMNSQSQLTARQFWIQLGIFP
jgi:HNH endonuclease